MADRSARLETMREMFVGAYRLYSWEFSSDGRPVYSNCPVWQIFGVIYSRGFSSCAISDHFEGSALPCVANEGMGLA